MLEAFAGNAVPAFVDSLVDVSGVADSVQQGGDADFVSLFGGADEVVERDVETAPDIPELLLHLVAVCERFELFLEGLLVDVERVLVVTHEEVGVFSGETLVASDDVGGDLLVGRP